MIETYLWRHELGSTAERASCAAVPHIFFTETVISNFDVSIQSKQNVVELQVTVDDTILVEVLQR
jgi:hypothetical protein